MTPISRWHEFLALDAPSIFLGFALFLVLFYGWLRSPGGVIFGALLTFLAGANLWFKDAVCAAAATAGIMFYLIFGVTATQRGRFHCFHDSVFFRFVVPAALVLLAVLIARLCCSTVADAPHVYADDKSARAEDVELATADVVAVTRDAQAAAAAGGNNN